MLANLSQSKGSSSSQKHICFVVPTKNEEKTIGVLIGLLFQWGEQEGHKVTVLIVDDSSDKTRITASAAGAHIVVGGGKGLGYAMLRGLKFSLEQSPHVIVSLDGDGQADLNDLNLFINPILNGFADLAVASRFLKNELIQYPYPLVNRLGVEILSWYLRRVTNLAITDSHGGIRAMSPGVAEKLELIGTHTYVQEGLVDAYENGFRIIEIPSKWFIRKNGKSRVVSSIYKYILYTLPPLLLRSKMHLRVLCPLGALQIGLAIYDLIRKLCDCRFQPFLLLEQQRLYLFVMLLFSGVSFVCFGIILDLLAQVTRRTKI